MVIEQLEAMKSFTNAEKQIAEYILKNPFELSELTAEGLGKKTYTSKASVFRFCKKMGVSGYDELRRRVEHESNEQTRLKILLEQEPISKETTLKDIISIIPSVYETAISKTKMLLDFSTISRVIGYMKRADKVDIYSGGITYSCASAARFKFLSIGMDCNAHSGVNEHYIMANRDRKVVALLLSFTGQNPTMIQIAEYLKKNGIFVVGVGGIESSKLKDVCDEYIEMFNLELVMSMEILTPFTSLTYVLDILFAALLIEDYEKNLKYSVDVIKNKFIDKADKSFYENFLE
ncbi:MurR/RpiR family transcriptional regulator [Candidatus Enterococcus ferrettii]|uniref:MurR/RpiR family transcriptional regulator n=1 Tax=Candidatus Enterococcus ferrettii TaxID=2815324 RepID=A0ABV0EW07_9ENTE|nr:MurR/RpiR family transcriptional regulator [Enterococcus sp. 665A]MBO1342603.1 MurR/RpiR family transcriptional regulator [Enterococcus sp. 665A]